MENDIKTETLLYDPMFAKKPVLDWEDSKSGGFFGKSKTKKAIFVTVLVIAVGASLLLSFRSLSKKVYSYDDADGGYMLSEFSGGEKDNILSVDYVINEDGSVDMEKPIVAVRNYAITCNETLDFIFIGANVKKLEYNCFYYCTRLKAVFVDENNPYYTSVDGVLYNRDMTEIILHPIRNAEYRATLAKGMKAPESESDCEDFLEEYEKLFPDVDDDVHEKVGKAAVYDIPDTVTDIAPFCFSYADKLKHINLPEGLKTIGQMSFFKCTSLEDIYLPDGLESIGPDGLSYCEKLEYIFVPASVTSIGHHAFFGCLGVDAIYLGAPDEDAVETGEGWLPKQNERSLRNVSAVFGAQREDG